MQRVIPVFPDFRAHAYSREASACSWCLDLVEEFNLEQIVDKNTRKAALLDLMYVLYISVTINVKNQGGCSPASYKIVLFTYTLKNSNI